MLKKTLKKLILAITAVTIGITDLLACEVCKRNQPEILQDITHGAGPEGTLDYIITWTAVIVVAITLIMSIRFIFKPGERNPDHIKNIIKNQ